MSNNVVDLSGALEIKSVSSMQAGRRQYPIVQGWVITGTRSYEQHPFMAIGQKAQVILDYARELTAKMDLGVEQDMSSPPFGVTVRGKLLSYPEHAFVEVKHISFFETTRPLVPGSFARFTTNQVRLQGYLAPLEETIRQYLAFEFAQPYLLVRLATEQSDGGGSHIMAVLGDLADMTNQMLQKADKPVLPVTLAGRLVSDRGLSAVYANYLCAWDGVKSGAI